MNSIIVLYAAKTLNLPPEQLQLTLSTFTILLFLPVFMGGYAIDHYLSDKSALFLGISLLASGYCTLAFSSIHTFYFALSLILTGNIFFKIVPASLLAQSARKQTRTIDSVFTLYYMAINTGSFVGMAIFPAIAKKHGFTFAFLLSSLGLISAFFTSLGFYYLTRNDKKIYPNKTLLLIPIAVAFLILLFTAALYLKNVSQALYIFLAILASILFIKRVKAEGELERKRMIVAAILMLEALIYFTPNWHTPLTLKFFATNFTDNSIFGFEINHSLFQTLNPFWIFIFSPLLAYYYNVRDKQGKDASITTKFAIGILFCAIGFLLLPIGYYFKGAETLVSANWVSISYLLLALGELLIGGLGLAMMAKLATPNTFNFMIGTWYLAPAGGIIIGQMIPNAPVIIQNHLHTDIALAFYSKQFLILGLIVLALSILMLIFSEKLSIIIDEPKNLKTTINNNTTLLTGSLSSKLSKKASNYLLTIGIIIAFIILLVNHNISKGMYNSQINTWTNHFSNNAESYLADKNSLDLNNGVETLKISGLFSSFIVLDSQKNIIYQFGTKPYEHPSNILENEAGSLSQGNNYKFYPFYGANHNLLGYYSYTTDFNDYFTPFLWLSVIYLLTLVLLYFVLKKFLTTGFNKELKKLSDFLINIESLTKKIKKTGTINAMVSIEQLGASEEEVKINQLFSGLVDEISNSHKHIREITGEFEKEKANTKLSQVALQVAHDIRSPLMALDMLVKRLPEVDVSKRMMLRDALNHIRDITNNLEKTGSANKKYEPKTVTQVAVLLDYILSERRAAFSKNPIDIQYYPTSNYYNLFIEVIASEMKRVLSNILNNACEAAPAIDGIVTIQIHHDQSNIIICISDNGPVISEEIFPSLFTRGFTTKTQGSGLGLIYAKETLAKWGGTIELSPISSGGVLAKIILPSQKPPSWFISSISLPEKSSVVCIDDCPSIFQAWQQRLTILNADLDLQYYESKEALIAHLKIQNTPCTYLVDYEFSGKPYTGLELINFILVIPGNRVYLVTSHSNDPEIQQFCELRNVCIIPKFFAFNMPVRILKSSPQTVILSKSYSYKDFKKSLSINNDIIFYSHLNEFLADMPLFCKSNIFFIEKELENFIEKELIAKNFCVNTYSDLQSPCLVTHFNNQ